MSSAAEQLKRVGIDYRQEFDFKEADRRREAARHAARVAFAKPIGSDPLEDDDLDENAKQDETIIEHQREREKWKAKLTELDYRERIGELIPADDVDKEWDSIARLVKDTLLNWPPRIAEQLARETDRRKVQDMLEQEIYNVLELLASSVEQAA